MGISTDTDNKNKCTLDQLQHILLLFLHKENNF